VAQAGIKLTTLAGDGPSPDGGSSRRQSGDLELRRRRLALGEACTEWEDDVVNLKLMATLAANTIDRLLTENTEPGKPDIHHIPKAFEDVALFTVYHLQHMCEDFEEKYYAALHGEAA
jgi:hypothetical protein